MGQTYPIIVVTDMIAMRGFDYRAPKKGICMILARSFETTRDAIQGLARVGRYGDRFALKVLNSVQIVDKDAEDNI